MSEFKYRFWVDDKMILPDDPSNDFVILPNGLIQKWNKSKACLEPAPGVIAMPYAGPTDQIGTEICEADIFSFGINMVGEVFYKKETASFLVRFSPPKNDAYLTFFLQMNGKPKIIGNSYQNPELKKLIEKNDAR